MTQTTNPLPPAGLPGTNLMSIDPINWRRYPSVPITKDMVTPAYVPVIASSVGAADVGATSDNNGETGTMSVSYTMDPAYGDSPAYGPKTQLEKSQQANLDPGTIIAPDVGKSYHGQRGDIEPHQPYPTSVAPTTVTPDAFLPSNYIPPVVAVTP